MEFLNRFAILLFLFCTISHQILFSAAPADFNSAAEKSPTEKLLQNPEYCASAKEFKDAHAFFLSESDFPLPEKTHLDLALKISKGCTGATNRFKKIYGLFKKTGVDLKKSIEAGVKFAHLSDDQANNFIEIFPQVYLKEFFDLDFWIALNVSMKLAEVTRGPIAQVKDDFTKLTRFCLSEKDLGLPIKNCAELALFLAEQSQYFPKGVSTPFIESYNYLRKDPRIQLPIGASLSLLKEVYTFGPLAPVNFKEALEYSLSSKGLNRHLRSSLSIALAISKNSNKNFPPPVIEDPTSNSKP